MNVGCVVVAAGSGVRFGSKKQFERINNKLVIDYSVDVLKEFGHIVIVAQSVDIDFLKERFDFACVVKGGAERMHSVYNGLSALECDIVLVHDAARPVINRELIERLIDAAKKYNAAVPVVRAYETLKRFDGEFIESTIDRNVICFSQTPQAFNYNMLKSAYDKILESEKVYTDEASVWEDVYGKVKVVEGNRKNIKITSKEDLEIVKCLLG